MTDYEIIVIGGGHAGVEAASASARMGCRTALVTLKKDAIGRMSCNPAVGGMAKGQLVKEIDALGGEMGFLTDKAAVQFRVLGRSKGPAMWSPRAQVDRKLYNRIAVERMGEIAGLDIIEDEALDIITEDGKIKGVLLRKSGIVSAKAVILAAGTFLEGKTFVGRSSKTEGRWGENPSSGLSENLEKLGFERMRLKTGTPPRIVSSSIEYKKLTPQYGDEDIHFFSQRTKPADFPGEQMVCYQAYTNSETIKIIEEHLWEAPLYDGTINAVGPRYCPSIETKAVNFPDRHRHLLFVEPEGWDDPLIYLNGYSSSLPEQVQIDSIHTIQGLENAVIARPGYAIEYDAFPPHQIKYTLETRLVEGLYFVGQILGTSGYEEAAGLGIMSGINAVLKLRGEEPFILDRSQAYIGVMIDDLITRGAPEPYRMFTSRAEYRLLIRSDNADSRLSEYGRKFGLVSENLYSEVVDKYDSVNKLIEILSSNRIEIDGSVFSGINLLKRPENTIEDVLAFFPEIKVNGDFNREVKRLTEIQVKYEGYISRQLKDVEKFRNQEEKLIPDNLDYESISSLSFEGRARLKKVHPRSLGAASRLYGVTPADIAVLAISLRKRTFHVEQ